MAEFDFNSLSSQEQEELRKQYLLNQAQNSLLTPGMQPDMSQYEFQKPENIGQAFGNVFKNGVLNPIQERLGMRESLRSVVKKMQIRDMQQDQAKTFLNAANRQQLQNYFTNQGMDAEVVNNLGLDELRELAVNRQGEVEFDNYGNPTQTNLMTGEVSSPYQLPSELQQYNRSMGQRGNALNTAQQALNQLPPGSPPYALPPGPVSLEAFRRQQKQADSDRESAATRNTRIDERAITRIDGITTPIYNGMSDIGSQRASLNQLTSLIEAGAQTGFAQGFLAEARNLGIDLGLNVADPTPELVFGAISNRIALPLVKSLGSNPTDTDLELILNSAPGLSKTPEGNKILIDTIKLKLDRQELIAKALMAFEDANRDLFRSDPLAYRQQLDRMILEIQNSEDFKKKSVFEMKARLGALQNREPKSNNLIPNL